MAVKVDDELVKKIRLSAESMLLSFGIPSERHQEPPLLAFVQLVEDHTVQPARSRDPWDQGKTYVCGTCQFYLEKAPGFGRCKGRGPTHRGYPAIYAHESPCRWHKLATSKA